MNWEAFGAIAEFAGALAVVASLIYLAIQVRQNTRALKGQTAHAVTERQQSELHWSHEIADTFTKAIETPGELNSAEAWSLSEWLTSAIVMRQNEYRQFKLGLLEPEVWQQSENVIVMLLSGPWSRNWWHVLGRDQVDPDLAARVDRLLEDTEVVDWSGALAALKDVPEAPGGGHGGE